MLFLDILNTSPLVKSSILVTWLAMGSNSENKLLNILYKTGGCPAPLHKFCIQHFSPIRRPQIKKFYKTDPPKSGNFDSKNNFKIFKNQQSNSEKTHLSSKKSKTYIRMPQIKKFYKTNLPKNGNSD